MLTKNIVIKNDGPIRICRSLGSPTHLASEPGRRFVFVASFAAAISGLSVREALLRLGYSEDELRGYAGQTVTLVEFGAGVERYPATWQNVLEIARELYPEISCTDYATVTAIHAEEWKGKEVALDAGLVSPAQYRAFLAKTCRVSGLFTGSGLTSGGVPEYVIPNYSLEEIVRDGGQVVDLGVL